MIHITAMNRAKKKLLCNLKKSIFQPLVKQNIIMEDKYFCHQIDDELPFREKFVWTYPLTKLYLFFQATHDQRE
jgi:hypothetical protein